MPLQYKILRCVLLAAAGHVLATVLIPYADALQSFKHSPWPHALIEFGAMFVSFGIFSFVWLMRDGLDDEPGRFLLLLGLCFFGVGWIDLLHALSFEGMPTFITPSSEQKASFLWLYGRYQIAIALLVALIWPPQQRIKWLTIGAVLITIMLGLAVVSFWATTAYLPKLPSLYIENFGLTGLYADLEKLLVALFTADLFLLWLRHKELKVSIFTNLAYFLVFTIFTEGCFAFYDYIYDTYSLLGHIYKIISYYFLFRAIYLSGLIYHFYTLSEMGKMCAEMLKQNMIVSTVIDIQMTKLKKLLPQAERIVVYLRHSELDHYEALYSSGMFNEQFPSGRKITLRDIDKVLGHKLQVISNPQIMIANFEICPPDISEILRKAHQIMYIPLMADNNLLGFVFIYIFHLRNGFSAEDVEKASVFQHFAVLAIDQARSHELISKLSYEDTLTSLPNRRWFFDQLTKFHYEANKYGIPFTVVYIDMNNLKDLNDNIGHDAGDEALKTCGKVIRDVIHTSDVAGRLGGDEFGIIFRHMDTLTGQQTVAKFKKAFAALYLPTYNYHFTLAVGSASYPAEITDLDGLLKLAADRMYEHKRYLKTQTKPMQQ